MRFLTLFAILAYCFSPAFTFGQGVELCVIYTESHAENFYSTHISDIETGYQRDSIMFLFKCEEESVINEFKNWALSNNFVVSVKLNPLEQGKSDSWILVKHKLEKVGFYYAYFLINKVAERKSVLKIDDCGSIAYK
ncbi:MAG: hypothetical protein GC178_17365 [Flavobacteriales bacterium]|nr:hypothetical protein [Flavobacteriales bacterium]